MQQGSARVSLGQLWGGAASTPVHRADPRPCGASAPRGAFQVHAGGLAGPLRVMPGLAWARPRCGVLVLRAGLSCSGCVQSAPETSPACPQQTWEPRACVSSVPRRASRACVRCLARGCGLRGLAGRGPVSQSIPWAPPGGPSLRSHSPGGCWQREVQVCGADHRPAPSAPASHFMDAGGTWCRVPESLRGLWGRASRGSLSLHPGRARRPLRRRGWWPLQPGRRETRREASPFHSGVREFPLALDGILTCLLCLIFSQTLIPAQASVVAADQEPKSFGSTQLKTWDEDPVTGRGSARGF